MSEWHPVEQMLPVYDERVLVTCVRGENRWVEICNRDRTTSKGEMWVMDDSEMSGLPEHTKVVAWMPLPEEFAGEHSK